MAVFDALISKPVPVSTPVHSVPGEAEVVVYTRLEPLLTQGGGWDTLLQRSAANTVFMTSGWLRSAWAAFGAGHRLYVPAVYRSGALIAAAAFVEKGGMLRFLGDGASDYLDFVFEPELSEDAKRRAVEQMLLAVCRKAKHFRGFVLNRIREHLGTPELLRQAEGVLFSHVIDTLPAPSMEAHAFDKALKKQSLKRSENRLKRQGELTSTNYSTAAEILPRLDALFAQHIARWEGSDSPSLFLQEENRTFYRLMVKALDGTGWLRFREVCWDGRLVAAHLGFCHSQIFTWYKPTYDPELAKLSPGEVLLKHLIEQSRDEGAREFDFTIGGEGFKMRFATDVRQTVELWVTPYRWQSRAFGLYQELKPRVREQLDSMGVWEKLKALRASVLTRED